MAHSGTSDPAQDRTPQDPDTLASTSSTTSASGSQLVSRRSLRATRTAHTAKAPAAARPGAAAAVQKSAPAAKDGKPAKRKGGWILNVGVMTVATGIIATMSLPAFAFNPGDAESSAFGPSAADSMKKAQAQSVAVGEGVTASTVSRDAATATSQAQLDSQKAAAAATAAAEAARQRAAVSLANYASYSGPSVSDFLANPPYPSFSLAQVFSVAKQYIGTPYVYGGASPAGFDCSGYVMYVYAQFGISLPHSVSGEAARGTKISINDAQPGDLIVMPGHIGFYAGNGNIMDAPDSGRSISIRPIWTSDYYVVRLGI
ncbi:C40 family peptidase [Leifsonia shinshuensis]|uniref:Cell wall-associated NlpC family hydrolase n=1 Tax=Leifsonia shinshuensis TaxID=150026 RepID=A0A853CWU3_9MICO|nr:C40 family peptidase [Leifsonia shinshuensis]NYJ23280.1 cell wall-associated NlpC family hydrolase [Leifsonia shinshuensis]